MRLLVFLVANCLLGAATALDTLPHGGKIWALLVAGSKDYFNYRHQADVCHAYQILHANGIPDENIVVMMYDDVASSPDNPTPGMLINEPGGADVYQGVPKDYTGEAVNASTFLAVLRGDKDAVRGIGSGRVLETGPHDHVFVNFVDHGAPGLLAMPSDMVYASQLLQTLQEMSAQSRFSKLVLYVEACESGSMFDGILPDDINVFATTAADPRESSYACYFDKLRNTYLGDMFSVQWMQDTEQEDLSRATLHHQFEMVRTRTNTSHVEEYGDLNVGALPLKSFIGFNGTPGVKELSPPLVTDLISSRDVPLAIIKKRLEQETDGKKMKKLQFKLHRMKKLRKELELQIRGIVRRAVGDSREAENDILESRSLIVNRTCYEQAVRLYDQKCGNIAKNTHALSQMYVFVNLCETGVPATTILGAIRHQCENGPTLAGVVI